MFDVMTTQYLREIKEFHSILRKKEELENRIKELIIKFEDETGVAVDLVKYQRDITLPLKKHRYIGLTITISGDEDK